MQDRKVAGANYIIDFYNEINALTHNSAMYSNLLLDLKHKNVEKDGLEETHKAKIKEYCDNLRYYIYKVVIKYKTIQKIGSFKHNPNIEEMYLKIKEQFVIKEEDILNFIAEVNIILTESIMKDLLVSSTNIINQIYSNNGSKTDNTENK